MKAYKLNNNFDSGDSSNILTAGIAVDQNKYFEQNGFRLSQSEISKTQQIIAILKLFIDSNDDYLIIYETIENISYILSLDFSKDEIDDMIIIHDHCNTQYLPQPGYKIGRKWTDLNFIVSKTGAEKVMDYIKIIHQSFSDSILSLFQQKLLSILIFKDPDIRFKKRKITFDVYQNQEVLNTIFSLNVWTTESKRKVIDLLKVILDLCQKSQIHSFINEGTLLGCIRYGRIMGWDDDLDLAVNQDKVDILIETCNKNGLNTATYFWNGQYPYFKVWPEDGEEIIGYEHKFPFIDIWPFELIDGSIIKYSFGKTYDFNTIYPLKKCFFENISVLVPNNADQYLDQKYPDWRTKIIVYPYSHREEKYARRKLEAYINMDDLC